MLDWHGGPYDPDDIDRPLLEDRLHKLASRRAAGKAAYEKSKPRS
jgi:hypothetical protein